MTIEEAERGCQLASFSTLSLRFFCLDPHRTAGLSLVCRMGGPAQGKVVVFQALRVLALPSVVIVSQVRHPFTSVYICTWFENVVVDSK
jgi:hypothetical protein